MHNCFVVGHTSFYAKMVSANGNVVEVDLERKSQKARPILTGTGGRCICVNYQKMTRKFRYLLAVCLAKVRNDVQTVFKGFYPNSPTKSVTPITHWSKNMSSLQLAATVLYIADSRTNILTTLHALHVVLTVRKKRKLTTRKVQNIFFLLK